MFSVRRWVARQSSWKYPDQYLIRLPIPGATRVSRFHTCPSMKSAKETPVLLFRPPDAPHLPVKWPVDRQWPEGWGRLTSLPW